MEGGIYIKVIAILLSVLGVISTIFGLIPFVFEFPDNPTASGPTNILELLIYLAFDGWYLPIGIILLLIGLFLLYKIKILLK